MSSRTVRFKENSQIEPCPKCGNKIEFVARSEQVCEDGCEIWIECKCGFNPFGENNRLEDVWGGVSDDNVKWAISEWNELVVLQQSNNDTPYDIDAPPEEGSAYIQNNQKE